MNRILCIRPPELTVEYDSEFSMVTFLSDRQIPNFEMQSEVGVEIGLGHLGLAKLETEDLGDA